MTNILGRSVLFFLVGGEGDRIFVLIPKYLTLLLRRSQYSNSLYCLPYKSYDVSLKNLELDQLTIP